MKIYMIRHGMTKGNRERRYVGSTDEGLLPEEAQRLKKEWQRDGKMQQSILTSNEIFHIALDSNARESALPANLIARQYKLPEIQKLYVSPMRRCRETAELIYPGVPQIIVEEFKECAFGEFEYHSYKELNQNPHYQRFIDTMGECGFPGGETRSEFQKRCVLGMEKILSSTADVRESRMLGENDIAPECDTIALVVHGGTIMALLDVYSSPHRDYYEWQIGTGKGFCANVERDVFGAWQFTDIHEINSSEGEVCK